MTGRYNLALVALSLAVSILSAYGALALTARIAGSRGRFRTAWLVGGSLAVGVGLWSAHFVGMLALQLPVPMSYDVETMGLSAAVAVAAAGLALFTASSGARAGRVGAAGVLVGLGLAR